MSDTKEGPSVLGKRAPDEMYYQAAANGLATAAESADAERLFSLQRLWAVHDKDAHLAAAGDR